MELGLEETVAGMNILAVKFVGVASTAIGEKVTGTPTLTLFPFPLPLPLPLPLPPPLLLPLPLRLISTLNSMRTLKLVSTSVVTETGPHQRRGPTRTG